MILAGELNATAIHRRRSSGVNAMGAPETGTAVVATGIPCRLVTMSASEKLAHGSSGRQASHKVFLASPIEIQDGDVLEIGSESLHDLAIIDHHGLGELYTVTGMSRRLRD